MLFSAEKSREFDFRFSFRSLSTKNKRDWKLRVLPSLAGCFLPFSRFFNFSRVFAHVFLPFFRGFRSHRFDANRIEFLPVDASYGIQGTRAAHQWLRSQSVLSLGLAYAELLLALILLLTAAGNATPRASVVLHRRRRRLLSVLTR